MGRGLPRPFTLLPTSSPDSEDSAWLALDLTPGLSDAQCRALLTSFGPPSAILGQSVASLGKFLPAQVAAALLAQQGSPRHDAALRWLEAPANHLITLADSDYPRLLLEIGDPPTVLYLKGRRELLGSRCLAVVGSRNATPQGLQNAESFSRALSDAGFAIVSGMALGIDAAAHRGGLAGMGSSIAVVGTGLDLIYPARNKALAHDLAEKGAMLSEFALGTPALAANFPRRNRIISGLSLGCLVVEAAVASGSLITARLAGDQGREVFALPGSIHSPLSRGCHQLIRQGAKLVESAEDILQELRPSETSDTQLLPSAVAGAVASAEDSVLAAMGFDPTSFDALLSRSGLAAEGLSARLTELEIEGRVAVLPGARYQRLG